MDKRLPLYLTACVLWVGSFASPTIAENAGFCHTGQSVAKFGKHDAAILLFTKCIDEGELTDASLATAYRSRGISHRKLGNNDAAIEDFSAAINLKAPDAWDDFLYRGNTYTENSAFDKAMADYAEAFRLRPEYHQAYFYRGIAFERQGKTDAAIQDFSKAFKLGLRTRALIERRNKYKF